MPAFCLKVTSVLKCVRYILSWFPKVEEKHLYEAFKKHIFDKSVRRKKNRFDIKNDFLNSVSMYVCKCVFTSI